MIKGSVLCMTKTLMLTVIYEGKCVVMNLVVRCNTPNMCFFCHCCSVNIALDSTFFYSYTYGYHSEAI